MRDIVCLKGRSLLTLLDLSDAEMLELIDFAAELKQRRRSGIRGNLLRRINLAMVFEKNSTRTRCAAAVAAADEGGRTEYLSSRETHLGKKESVADTAQVLGRMFDGIFFRGFRQQTVETLAQYSGVPVWNGLTDDVHPTQILADLLTIKEHFGRLAGLRVSYVGDGRNNVANSLMRGCAKAGMHYVNGTPEELAPDERLVAECRATAERNGGSVKIVYDAAEAVAGSNVVYTDVWVSMGEEDKQEERIKLLKPFQINLPLMQATGNLDNGQVIFLHCLPAFHDNQTDVSRSSGALEVTDEVFSAPWSKVFDEAENRMHTIKAMFVASLRGEDRDGDGN